MTTEIDTQIELAGLSLLAAREVLEEEKEPGADAETALQRATEAAYLRAVEAITWPHDPPFERLQGTFAVEGPLPERGGMFLRDDVACSLLRALGPIGEEAADEWASLARERWIIFCRQQPLFPDWDKWRTWSDRTLWMRKFTRTIARVLWHGEVRAAVEAKRPRKAAALSLLLVNDLSDVYLSHKNTVRVSDAGDGRAAAAILSPDGEQLASTPVLNASEIERAQRGFVAFRSYLGHRILRRIPSEVWARHIAGERDPRVLTFNGIAGFLDWLGVRSKKHGPDALALLRAGQDFRRTWADNGRPTREVGGLWSYDLDERACTGKHAHLEINVNRPLAPFFVREELERGDDRTLVPLVPMPPTVGSPNTWAGQAAFQFLLVRRLVEDRADVATQGGALLVADDLSRLAAAAGVKPGDLPRLLDRWLATSDGDAVLEQVERDRYHLADNALYGQARRHITDSGRLSERRRNAGRAAVRQTRRTRRR